MYKKLDPTFKAEWIAALRSGEFPQGRKYLNRNNEYCCLGVRCELDVKAGRLDKGFYDGTTSDGIIRYGYGSTGTPGPTILKRWGLSEEAMNSLITMNDGQRDTQTDEFTQEPKTFSEIADWIEENL